MSIVERALEKAQARAAQQSAQEASRKELPTEAPPEAPPAIPIATLEPSEETTRPAPAAEVVALEGGRAGSIQIDVEQLRAAGRLASPALAARTDEEFRRIKWPVLNAIMQREGATPARNNMVLVTSAVPGEGKTFTALNLALSIAREQDWEVLLVDGDLAQPALTASLGLGGRPGLTELLDDPAMDVADIIYTTNVRGLSVMPAGRRAENTPELLSSDRMGQVASRFGAPARPTVVVIDSPPVLATNEAQVLSRYAGQILLVVRADFTEQRVVMEALGLLDRTKPVNTVLNRVEPSMVSRYYGYYYYGYGKGSK
jgi:exopolysaccharide/PEP-CTERM locus tyrosine autokinase